VGAAVAAPVAGRLLPRIGQRVLVKFMKPGQRAGVKRAAPAAPGGDATRT